MRLPNGYGSVTKLSGKRRKPYMVRITTGCVYDAERDDYIQKRAVLGYYAKKSEALEALANYSKSPYSVEESNMTVRSIWDLVKGNIKVSDRRQQRYQSAFDMYMNKLADMKIKDVKTRHLQQAIDECPMGDTTLSTMKAVMNHIFRYAAQNDLIEKNYVDYIKLRHVETDFERVVYTDEEVRALWEHSDDDKYAFILILLYQGMRIQELLDVPKIDLEARTITIQEAKNEYSKRTIPINNAVYDLVARYAKKPFDLNRSKIDYFSSSVLGHKTYDTRHTFATKCNKLEIPVLVIQRIMGHRPETILHQVYTHLTIKELSEAINRVQY